MVATTLQHGWQCTPRERLQNHNRVDKGLYLPTKQMQAELRRKHPGSSARVLLQVLRHFIDDIVNYRDNGLASEDVEILQDIIELLNFQIDVQFRIINDCLIESCRKMSERGVQLEISYRTNEYSTFEELADYLESYLRRVRVEFEYFVLLARWEGPPSEWNPDTMPATSFRELILRQVLNSVIQSPDVNTDHYISLLRVRLREFAGRLRTGGRLSNLNQSSNAWVSATFVLLIDTEEKLILTGGTKPASSPQRTLDEEGGQQTANIDFLKTMAREICRARLGPRFHGIINECSRQFSQNAHEKDTYGQYIINTANKSDQEIDSLYQGIQNWTRCDAHARIREQAVHLWAFDGYTFEPKPPCIRCRYLYSSWHLEAQPDTSASRRSELKQLRGNQMVYHELSDPPCGYCAETVAAAQLFALTQGPVVCTG